jgi:hypothetical protein
MLVMLYFWIAAPADVVWDAAAAPHAAPGWEPSAAPVTHS